jgi:hypothetical protein
MCTDLVKKLYIRPHLHGSLGAVRPHQRVLLLHDGGVMVTTFKFKISRNLNLILCVIIDDVSDNALTSVLQYYNVKEACENASGHFTLPPIVTTNVRYSILLSVVTWVAIYVVLGTLFKSENVLCTYHHPPPPLHCYHHDCGCHIACGFERWRTVSSSWDLYCLMLFLGWLL